MTGRNPLVAWILGWLLPGAGHAYLGQRARGAYLGGALVACFAAGVLLGGRGTVSRGHPEFLVLQWGAGLPAGAAWAAGTPEPADVPVRRRELGVLYTLVPSLLNMVAAFDAAARAAGANPGGPIPGPVPPEPPPASPPLPGPPPAPRREEEGR